MAASSIRSFNAKLQNTQTNVLVELASNQQYRITVTGNPAMGGLFDLAQIKLKKTKAGKPPILLAITTKEGEQPIVVDFHGDETARNLAHEMLQQSRPVTTTTTTTTTTLPTSTTPIAPPPSHSPDITVMDSSIFGPPRRGDVDYDKETRAEVLGERPQLGAMYEALVGTSSKNGNGIEEDTVFWKHRESLLKEKAAEKQLGTGMSSEALKSDNIGLRSLKVRGPTATASTTTSTSSEPTTSNNVVVINKEWIQRVFLEHPSVLTAYEKHVKGEGMSEKEFWTLYITSKHVLGEKRPASRKRTGASGSTGIRESDETTTLTRKAKEIFGSVTEASLKRENMGIENDPKRLDMLISTIDPAVDLMATAYDAVGGLAAVSGITSSSQTGFGVVHRDGTEKIVADSAKELVNELRTHGQVVDTRMAREVKAAVEGSDPLLSSFNRKSTLAVRVEEFQHLRQNKLREGGGGDDASNKLRLERLHDTILEQVELDGTLGADQDEAAAAKGMKMKRIPMAATTSNGAVPAMEDVVLDFSHLQWDPQRALLPPPSSHGKKRARDLVAAAGRDDNNQALAIVSLDQLNNAVPGIKDTLLAEFFAVDEMCRNYWAMTDVRDGKAKLKMAERLKTLYVRLDVEMRNYMTSVLPPLLVGATVMLKCPLAMLDRALTHLKGGV